MSQIPVLLTQGDYIYYYDDSIGQVVSRNWSFFGGNPTGSTTFAQTVRYVNQNKKGYTTKLTVTDLLGAKDDDIQDNFIRVLPEIEDLRIVAERGFKGVSSSLLGDTNFYSATGSIRTAPTGSYYYEWILPENSDVVYSSGIPIKVQLSATGDSQNIPNPPSVPISTWFKTSGYYFGPLGSIYESDVILNIKSPLGNLYSSQRRMNYIKKGATEVLRDCKYEVGIFGLNPSDLINSKPSEYINTSSIGMGGNGDVLVISGVTGAPALPPSNLPQGPLNLNFKNSYTRVDQEKLSIYTGSWDFKPDGINYGLFTGKLIMNSDRLLNLENLLFTSTGGSLLVNLFNLPRYTWFERKSIIDTYFNPYITLSPLERNELFQGNYAPPNSIGNFNSTSKGFLGKRFYFADTEKKIYEIRKLTNYHYLYNNIWDWGNDQSLKSLSPLTFDFSGIQASISSMSYYFAGLESPARQLGLTGGESNIIGISYFENSQNPDRVFKMGPCLPSGRFAKSDIILHFNFYLDSSGYLENNDLANAESVFTVSVNVGSSGSAGNSKDGNLIYCNSSRVKGIKRTSVFPPFPPTISYIYDEWPLSIEIINPEFTIDTYSGEFGDISPGLTGIGECIANEFESLGLINNSDIVYENRNIVLSGEALNIGTSDGLIKIRTSPYFYPYLNEQYAPNSTGSFGKVNPDKLPHGIQFSIPRVISPVSGTPLGLTGPSNVVGMTITDNSDQWFSHMPDIPKFKAYEWLCLTQNFLMNPYQYQSGATGSLTGWIFGE